MPYDIVLNELSFVPPATNREHARAHMSTLVSVIRQALKIAPRHKLTTPPHFYTSPLALDYRLSEWLIDTLVGREERGLLLESINKTPYITNPAVEYMHGTSVAVGLGLAAECNGLAISLANDDAWSSPFIVLDKLVLEHDGVSQYEASARNAATLAHIDAHYSDLVQDAFNGLNSGADIVHHARDLFPNIEFCQSAANQLNEVAAGEPLVNFVARHLRAIDSAADAWVSGQFSLGSLPDASTEGEATRKKYGREREFICPDEVARRFYLHTKIMGLNYRIHFLPRNPSESILIGYVGPHLRTVHDP